MRKAGRNPLSVLTTVINQGTVGPAPRNQEVNHPVSKDGLPWRMKVQGMDNFPFTFGQPESSLLPRLLQLKVYGREKENGKVKERDRITDHSLP
jgi:hypothetical protein